MSVNTEITDLIKKYEADVKNKNVDDLLDLHSVEIQTFDLMAPFQYSGKRELGERIQEWFDSYDGEIKFNFNNVIIEADEQLAVCHALVNTSGTLNNGERSDMWTRSTLALKKEQGNWKIFHEHTSEPIDMRSGKAITQLSF